MTTTERHRLFVSIAVPGAIKAQLDQARLTLKEAVPRGRIRWTPSGQFHLTLRFLGDVDVEQIGVLGQRLGDAVAGGGPLALSAVGLGFFADARLPRVVWAGAEDESGRLAKLQQAVERVCREFSSQKPEGRFFGHMTLGRIQSLPHAELHALAQLVAGMAQKPFGAWQSAGVDLMRSELSSSGACYSCVKTFPLT